MSLEQSIADLVAIGTQNLALPQQIANLAATQVAAIGTEYQNRVATLSTKFYVSATGDNAAAGTVAAPIFGITEALRRTPRGGLCVVYLMSNYGITVDTDVDGRHLLVTSSNTSRYAISFDRSRELIGNVNVRVLRPFRPKNGGTVRFSNVTIVMPPGDGTFLPLPQDTRSAVIKLDDVAANAAHAVGFYYCDLNFPDAPFGPLVGTFGLPTMLTVNNCVVAGSSMAGKWLYNIVNPAGTDAKSLPWLVTNLDTV